MHQTGAPVEDVPAGFIHRHGAGPVPALRAPFGRHGCLIVRTMIAPAVCAGLADTTRRTLKVVRRIAPPHIHAQGNFSLGLLDASAHQAEHDWWPGTVPVAAASAALPEIYKTHNHLFENSAVRALIATPLPAYFYHLLGGPCWIACGNSRVRCQTPDNTTAHLALHQDAASGDYGDGVVVTAWIPLVACGVTAPGLAVLPRRTDSLLPVDDRDGFWTIDPAVAAGLAGALHVGVFAAGDVLFFRHDTVHGTSAMPDMTETRYSLDIRAFAGSPPPVVSGPLLRVEPGGCRFEPAAA